MYWLKESIDDATGTNRFMPGPGSTSPERLLKDLVESSKKVEKLGSEEIRGIPTTHYRAHLEKDKVGMWADPGVVDAWIDEQGLPRRIRIPFGGESEGAGVFDLFDFGVPVDVEAPPANEIVSEKEFDKMMEKECGKAGTRPRGRKSVVSRIRRLNFRVPRLRQRPDLTNRNRPDDRGEMTEAADIHTWEGPTMDVTLKIWRVDEDGDRDLVTYELEAPDWACLLDVLDLIKDRHDGTLAYRKSCRMMICGSCGMRMDGRAVLACKERMKPIVESGHVPVISPMGNLPIIKDLVVDMGPFWQKIRDVKPWLDPGYDEATERERIVSQQQMNVIQKEALCIMCGCCVSECNAMESDPEFRGPAALAKGMRFVGDVRDQTTIERLNDYNDEHGIWDCTRCYFCNERCPKGVDPRDAIAKLGAESVKEGVDWDMGVKHAKWFITSTKTTGWLRETELVPKTQGILSALKETKFALALARRGKVPPPGPIHVAADVDEARNLYDLVKEQGRDGALGIVQGEAALAKIEHIEAERAHEEEEETPA